MPNEDCIAVCRYRLFRTIWGSSPRFSSMTTRMPRRSDSSRRSEIPVRRLSLTSSAIFSMRRALLTW